MENIENVVIIGSGPAGYTAAIYLGREGFNPLVITGMDEGGQLELTSTVENFPGFPDGIEGPDLMINMKKQAEKFGTRFVRSIVNSVSFDSSPYKITTSDGEYYAKSIIIATGASSKWLGIPSEKKFIGRGISSCATCDAPFFRGKNVAVVGGGDTAMEDSIFLTKFVNSVTIIHRRDAFRASKIMQERALSNPKIKVIWNSVVEEVLGDSKVTGVKIRNTITNELKELPLDGIFVAIGYKPNTDFLISKLDLDENGYIITEAEVKTKIPGVFAAGDVADRRYKQAITASASGAKAALEVRNYIAELQQAEKQ
ncbi:MAG: thioredoxin-disulfide reductase [Candidatus Micrarchaeia archaeon]